MPPVNTDQYRPVSEIETAADAGLSVRALRDIINSINNYGIYVANFKFGTQLCVPAWESWDSDTDERVIAVFAPRHIPDGFNRITWGINAYQVTDTAETTDWKLYQHNKLYIGDKEMDTTKLGFKYTASTITADGALNTNQPKIVNDLDISERYKNYTWLVLTAQNSDVSVRTAIRTIDMWPSLV